MSLFALKSLGLDYVWWLVSPQNPLKPRGGMAPFEDRLRSARGMARHPRLIVTNLEQVLGTRYTADTFRVLTKRFSATKFVWLMGADNLIQISSWHRWTDIFTAVPVAVFAREPYTWAALREQAAQAFRAYRHSWCDRRHLAAARPPAWLLCRNPIHRVSATAIRRRLADCA